MSTKRALGCFVGILITLTACSSSSSKLTARIEGSIAFLSRPSSGNAELYLISIDCASLLEDCSNQLLRLVDKADDRYSPSWSPDGKRIAFVSFGDAEDKGKVYSFSQVYVINSDGSEKKRIVHMPSMNAYPKWSPDGSRIAFIRWGRGIYTVDPAGDDLTALIDDGCTERCSFYPQGLSWSPDGTRLAVDVWTRGGWQTISMLEAKDIQMERDDLATLAIWAMTPAWSPDGKQIAFTCYRAGDDTSDICTIDVDSGEETRLTNAPGMDTNPTWSPDGAQMAFESNRDDNWEIYVMNADGSQQTNITNNPAKDSGPAWSPDSALIAFQSCRDDRAPATSVSCDNEIYITNADGSVQLRLTDSLANNALPVWAPR